MTVAKVIEVSASSKVSFEDAINQCMQPLKSLLGC